MIGLIPWKVYVSEIPENTEEQWSIRPILEGITKNHGFCVSNWEGGKGGICYPDLKGEFLIKVPDIPDKEWQSEVLIKREVSDIAVVDIDQDGIDEIITIEPFHGNKLVVNKLIEGKWQPVFEYPISFGHVVWGCKLLGIPSIPCGIQERAKRAVLFTVKIK